MMTTPTAPAPADPPTTGSPPEGAEPSDRSAATGARRFGWASLAGSLLSMSVLAWLATRGFAAWFDQPRFGDFYDAQARSLFHGRWDMSTKVLSFERFNIGGHYYTYFGPTPALLRMPILLVTDSLDGRLSRLAMIAACAVTVWAIARLSWLARRTVRGDGPLSRGEAEVAAGVVVVASLGTMLPYLAGWTAVYHEAIVWGAAFALVSYGALIAWTLDSRARDLVLAAAAAALSVLARGSVGFGAIAALGLVALVRGWAALQERRAGRPLDLRMLGGLAVAVVVPIVLYGYVNWAKFGAAFGAPPFGKQDLLVSTWPPRRAAMANNGGSLLGLRYAPTILYHYFRPDGVVLDRLFPFVLMRVPTRVFGGNVFEALRQTTSVPAASPLPLLAAAAGGVVAIVRRGARAVWLAPVVGTVVGSVGAVSLAFVDERYQGDFIPLLVVPGVLGAWFVVDWLAGRSRALVAAAVAIVVVLGTWSIWANFAAAFVYQRAQTPFSTVADRASLVKAQLELQDLVGGLPSRVTAGATLPADASGRAGDLFVLGDCAGVYRHDGFRWQVVEQTPRSLGYHLGVDLDPDATGRQPVLSSVDDLGTTVIWARNEPGGRVAFDYQFSPAPGGPSPVRIPLGATERAPDGTVDVSASIDFRDGYTPYLRFRAGDAPTSDRAITELHGPVVLGRQDGLAGSSTLAGRIARRPMPTPLCDRLVGMGLHLRGS
ncbi:MAG: hypothetical protein ACHQIG_02140 [Acidimicrobiia bacterium]